MERSTPLPIAVVAACALLFAIGSAARGAEVFGSVRAAGTGASTNPGRIDFADPVAISGASSVGPLVPDAPGSAATDAEIEAEYGFVAGRALSHALAAEVPDTNSPVLGNGEASGGWTDPFVLAPTDPLRVGELATVRFRILLSGATSATSGGALHSNTFSSWRGTVSFGLCPMSPCSFQRQGSVIDAGSEDGGMFVVGGSPGPIEGTVKLRFGQTTAFRVDLDLDVQAITTEDADALASVEFANTLRWDGFIDVRGEDGLLVTAYSVASESGTDWSRPLPEPGNALAGAACLAAIAALRALRRTHTSMRRG